MRRRRSKLTCANCVRFRGSVVTADDNAVITAETGEELSRGDDRAGKFLWEALAEDEVVRYEGE